jgi:hypothetical protein
MGAGLGGGVAAGGVVGGEAWTGSSRSPGANHAMNSSGWDEV